MSIPIDPRGMTASNWAAQMTILLVPYGTIPKLLDDGRWRDWASLVVALPAIAGLGAARPEPFSDWQQWAAAFNQTVKLLQT